MGLLPPNIEKLKQRGDIEGLVKALSHKQAVFANQAKAALTEMKDPRAIPFLVAALEDKRARLRAIWTLATLRSPHAIEPLVALLGGDELPPDSQERQQSAVRLAELKDPRAGDHLVALLEHKPSGRVELAVALTELNDPRAADALMALLEEGAHLLGIKSFVRALGKVNDPRAIGPLVKAFLESEKTDIRISTRELLEQMADASAIEPLKAALQGKNLTKHMSALGLLGKLGDDWAIDQLIAILEDPQAGFDPARDRAAQQLGLRSSVAETRTNAVHYLVGHKLLDVWFPGIGGPRAIEAVARVLEHADANRLPPYLRDAISDGLKECGDPQALEALSAATSVPVSSAKVGELRRSAEDTETLDQAERNDSPVSVTCDNCGGICKALGRPVDPNKIMVMTPEIAMMAARYCEGCNIVVCGRCVGVREGQAGLSVGGRPCPRCGTETIYASVSHLRATATALSSG